MVNLDHHEQKQHLQERNTQIPDLSSLYLKYPGIKVSDEGFMQVKKNTILGPKYIPRTVLSMKDSSIEYLRFPGYTCTYIYIQREREREREREGGREREREKKQKNIQYGRTRYLDPLGKFVDLCAL